MPEHGTEAPLFALDRYERHAARVVGAELARERRRELESHLRAGIESRLMDGVAPAQAEAEAMSALGDLDRLARAERPRRRPGVLGHTLLLAAPWVLWIEFMTRSGSGRGVFPTWTPAVLLGFAVAGAILGAIWTRWIGLASLVVGVFASSYAIDALITATGMFGRRGLAPGALEQGLSLLILAIPLHVVAAGIPEILDDRRARCRA